MNLSELPKLNASSKKRIGRGHGSGRGGHTSTRGAKGQKARGSIGLFFEGTKLKKSWLKRLPLLRGKGKFNPQGTTLGVNLKYLNLFKKGEEVNLQSLMEKGILTQGLPANTSVKILGEGELKVPVKVALPCSAGALKKIIEAGGEVVGEENNQEEVKTEPKEKIEKKKVITAKKEK